MEEIDKLHQLFKAGEVELMWQLSKSMGINGVELWTSIYNEFKDWAEDLKISSEVWIFEHRGLYEFREHESMNRFDTLENVILQLIKYLDGELR